MKFDEKLKEKYKQLCLSHQFGGIRTMNTYKRYMQPKKTTRDSREEPYNEKVYNYLDSFNCNANYG